MHGVLPIYCSTVFDRCYVLFIVTNNDAGFGSVRSRRFFVWYGFGLSVPFRVVFRIELPDSQLLFLLKATSSLFLK